jgi:hypothetical protein
MSKLDAFRSEDTPAEAATGNIVDFPTPKRRGKMDGFAQTSLRAAAEFSRKMKNADHVIFTMLVYKAFRTKSQTFVMSNDLPTVHGVNREAKRRALSRFEEAGVIRIERRGHQSPIVTLLVKFD